MKYNDYSPRVRKYLTWSLEYAIMRRLNDMFKKHQKVPTHMVMAGNVMKASPDAINEFKETGLDALKMMPKAMQVIQMEEPPALKNGRVWPVTGIKFVATLMLTRV